MKKKWLQRIISMVLAVGMLMPSVGAYAEIIDHPTNYKTATSMPMYDNPEIQITEGEYIVEEIVDGSEISSLSNEHKYLVTFAVRDAYQGSFTFIKPSSGILGVDYIKEIDHVNVETQTTIEQDERKELIGYEQYYYSGERSVTKNRTIPGYYKDVITGYKDVVDRVVTTVVREAYNETRYKYVPEEVEDVPGHFETTRYLYKRGYYKRVSTIDHDGVPTTKMVWVPDEYRSYRSWVKTTYKTILVKTPYVVHHPEVTSTKTYYKEVPVYGKEWVPPQTVSYTVLEPYSEWRNDYSKPIFKTIPAVIETREIKTNVYRYAYLYKASKRMVPEVDAQMFENVDIIKSYTQTIKGYKRGGSYYEYDSGASVNSSTWIIKDGSRYVRGGQEVDFDPNIYQSSQGKYINETEKRIAESTGIKIFTVDGDTNGISGYIYDNKLYFNDDSPLPSKYVYLKDGSYYNYDGKLIEDFEIQVYQGSNGKYLNSTDRKNQLISEISGLSKGTVSGNNRLYEIYRDYPEVRDHVVAKGPFHYASIENGEYLEPSTSPRELKSSTVLEIVSETDYNENHLLKEIAYLDKLNRQDYEKLYNYYHSSSTSEAAKAAIRAKGPFYYHDTTLDANPPYFKELEPKYNEQRYEIVSYEQYLEGTKKTLAHNESIAPYVRNIIGDNQNDTEGFIYAVVEGTTYHFQGSVHVGLNGDLIFGYNDGNLYPQEFGSFNEYIQSEEHRVSYFTKDAYELYKDSLPTAEKSPLEVLQDALGIVGMIPIPGVGEVADILNALIYFTRAAVEEDSQERKNLILKGSGSLLLAVGLIAAEKVLGKYVIPAVIKNTPEAIDALARYLYTQDIDLKLAFEGISYALKGMSGKLDSIGTWLGKYTARSFGDAVLNLNKGLVKQIDSLDRFVSNTFTDLMDVLPSRGAIDLISEADRLKINSWSRPPSDDLYLKYKDVYDDDTFFNPSTGKAIYPGENGNIHTKGFTNGEFEIKPLKEGTIIDRFGDNADGNYFSPAGTSYEARALPPYMETATHNEYKVLKEFNMKEGEIAPLFGQTGKGTQYYTDIQIKDFEGNLVDATVENLERYEYIINLKDL